MIFVAPRGDAIGGLSRIWQAYELGEAKAGDMLKELRDALTGSQIPIARPVEDERFSIVWLVDDFSGSGNTYIRFDSKKKKFSGKIRKIYDRILTGDLVDPSYYEVVLLLYVATRKAIDHIVLLANAALCRRERVQASSASHVLCIVREGPSCFGLIATPAL